MAGNHKKSAAFLPKTLGGNPEAGDEKGYFFKGKAGQWHHDPLLLDSFPSDIDVGKAKVRSQVLTSIPDIWARMYFFHHALIEKGHPGHAEVVKEWRGLLGLLCLAETYGVRLSFEEISLPENPEDADLKIKRGLAELLPHESFRTFFLILADDILVGATSSYSIVFTPPTYDAPHAIPWRTKEGRLTDPATYLRKTSGKMASGMLSSLKAWITDVSNKTINLPVSARDQGQLSRALVGEWADLLTASDYGIFKEKGRHTLSIVPEVDIHSLAPIGVAGQAVKSDCQIAVSALRAGFVQKNQPAPILYWEKGWEKDRVVYQAFKSKSVPAPQGAQGNQLFEGKISHDWINPELLFFTDLITKVQLERGSTKCVNSDKYLLPLRKEILEYFDPEFLSENFELEDAGNDTVTATLKIPLSGGDEAIIQRQYQPNRQRTTFDRDAVVLWPNIRLDNWEHYYLFARYPESGPSCWSCEPVGTEPPVDSAVLDEEGRAHMWRLKEPPEAIQFTDGGNSAGLILPDLRRSAPTERSKTWGLAIDFGTTNTSVAYRDNSSANHQAVPLDFKPRHHVLMSFPEGHAMSGIMSEYLVPEDPLHLGMPFPSVYLSPSGDRRPDNILLGNVPFEQTYFRFIGRPYDTYDTGLKWEKDETAIQKVNNFLSQVLLMSLLEARCDGVGEIDLKWTYPSAFERKRRIRFDNIWRVLARESSFQTGFVDENNQPTVRMAKAAFDDNDATTTEGVAVCGYARKFHRFTPAGKNVAQLILDIGGGTTDTGIWMGGKVLIQSSILIAADIMARFIHSSTPMTRFLLGIAKFEEIELELWTKAFQSSRNYGSAINYFYRYNDSGGEVTAAIAKSGKSSEHLRRAISLATLMFGGVSYYAGMLLKAGLQKKQGPDTEIDGINVLFCGNGSRMLDWLGDEVALQRHLGEFFKGGFGASGDKLSLRIDLSDRPKLEASMGILHPVELAETIPNPSVIVGEDGISINGTPKDRLYDLAEIPLDNSSTWKSVELTGSMPALRELVDLYNRLAEEDELILDPIPEDFPFERLQDHVLQAFYDFSGDPEGTSMPSAFAAGLNTIADYMIDGKI